MNKPDLAETVNKGHDALISELRSLRASDGSFPYWLTSAALEFCVAFTNVKLVGKLTHIDDLEKVVKEGFKQMKLSGLSKKERDHAKYCLARFRQISDEKASKSKSIKARAQTCYDLRSKRNTAGLKISDDPQLENKVKAATNLKNGKTHRHLKDLQNVSGASTPLRVKRNAGEVKLMIATVTIIYIVPLL